MPHCGRFILDWIGGREPKVRDGAKRSERARQNYQEKYDWNNFGRNIQSDQGHQKLNAPLWAFYFWIGLAEENRRFGTEQSVVKGARQNYQEKYDWNNFGRELYNPTKATKN